jgi:hypothetical protein
MRAPLRYASGNCASLRECELRASHFVGVVEGLIAKIYRAQSDSLPAAILREKVSQSGKYFNCLTLVAFCQNKNNQSENLLQFS